MMKRKLIVVMVLIFSLACEERSDIPQRTQAVDFIVIEGVLTTEFMNHRIKLTHPVESLNSKAEPVSGASVTISDGITFIKLLELPFGSGEYYTPGMRAIARKTYEIAVYYQGNTFTAQDKLVAVEPLEPIKYHAVGDSFQLDNYPSGQNPNFIEQNISWEGTSACSSPGNCKGRLIYYDLKNTDVNDIFKPEKEPFTFPKGTTIIRRKFSVSDSYRDFLRAMLSETEWSGGVFDVQRTNVPTNFSAGAVGFFAVSTVVSDTTVVQ